MHIAGVGSRWGLWVNGCDVSDISRARATISWEAWGVSDGQAPPRREAWQFPAAASFAGIPPVLLHQLPALPPPRHPASTGSQTRPPQEPFVSPGVQPYAALLSLPATRPLLSQKTPWRRVWAVVDRGISRGRKGILAKSDTRPPRKTAFAAPYPPPFPTPHLGRHPLPTPPILWRGVASSEQTEGREE